MITNLGKKQMLKVLAGKSLRFADQFAVGLSDEVLTTSATSLDFAWATVSITDSYIDAENDMVVFYARLPAEISGSIKEIGLVSQTNEFIQSGLPNSLIYSFEPNEMWYGSPNSESISGGQVGQGNMKLTDSDTTAFIAKATNKIDVSRYDTVKLRVISTGVTEIRVSLMNDDANFISNEITLTNGENKISQSLSTWTATGLFNKTEVNTIKLEVVTVSGGTNSLEFDAMTLVSDLNGGLVARETFSTAFVKRPGASMDIEYGVTIS